MSIFMCSYPFDKFFFWERQTQQIIVSQIFVSGTKNILQPKCFLLAILQSFVSKGGVKTSQTFQESSLSIFHNGKNFKKWSVEAGTGCSKSKPLCHHLIPDRLFLCFQVKTSMESLENSCGKWMQLIYTAWRNQDKNQGNNTFTLKCFIRVYIYI